MKSLGSPSAQAESSRWCDPAAPFSIFVLWTVSNVGQRVVLGGNKVMPVVLLQSVHH